MARGAVQWRELSVRGERGAAGWLRAHGRGVGEAVIVEISSGRAAAGTSLDLARRRKFFRRRGPPAKYFSDPIRPPEFFFQRVGTTSVTHQRLPSGRYMVRLPFKETQGLDESRAGAVRMLHRMESKCSRNTDFKETYHSFLREYEELVHMSKTSHIYPDSECYYLPHHGVLKESSTTHEGKGWCSMAPTRPVPGSR